MGAMQRSQPVPDRANAVPRTAVTNIGINMGNDKTANNAPRDAARAIIAAMSVVPATSPSAPVTNSTTNGPGDLTCMRNRTIARTATNTVSAQSSRRLNSNFPK